MTSSVNLVDHASMARTVSVGEVSAQLEQILAEVEAGGEVIIARGGKPVAQLVRIERIGKRPLGLDKGVVIVSEDFDAPLPGWR